MRNRKFVHCLTGWMLLGAAGINAGMVPVRLPLSKTNYERYVEVVDGKDFADVRNWSLKTGPQLAPVQLDRCSSFDGQDAGVRVTASWQGEKTERAVVQISSPEISQADPDFSVRVRFGDVSQPLWLRLVDAEGETFQYALRSMRAEDDWELYVTQQPRIDHWGGNNDAVVDLPFRLDSVVLVQPVDYYEGNVAVEFDQLQVVKRILEPKEDCPLHFALPVENIGHVYAPGEEITLCVQNENGPGWAVDWTVDDFWGHSKKTGSLSLPDAGLSRLVLNQLDRGFYTLKLKVSNSAGLVDIYDFRFAVLAERSADRIDWDEAPYFGMCAHYDHWSHDSLPLMARYGAQIQRVDFFWRMSETAKGVYEFPKAIDQSIESCLTHGMQTQGIINYGNPIYENPSYRNGTFPSDDRVRSAYADYAKFLAGYHRFEDGTPRVKYYEVWNEWTYGCGMRVGNEPLPGNTPENYVELLKKTYPVLKAANPGIQVIGIGGDNPWKHKEAIAEMIGLGVLDYCDAISLHPYRQPVAPEFARPGRTDMVSEIKVISDMMDAHDRTDTKIWLTEFGWPTWAGKGGVSEQDQARFLVRSYVMLKSIPRVENLMWYDFKDDGNNYWNTQEQNFGMLLHEDYNYAPKPAAVAYAVLSDILTGAEFVERQASDPNVYRYSFRAKEGRRLIVAWSTNGSVQQSMEIPGTLRVMDMMGHISQQVSADTPVTLTLSENPIYILSE